MACKFVMEIVISLHNPNFFIKLFIYDDVARYSMS